MPYRYGKNRRRIQAGRRRRFQAKYARARGLSMVHRYKEWYDGGVITVAGGAGFPNVLNFQLNSLANAGNFKSLYDLYKITGVKVTLVPQHNVSDFSQGAATALPMLYMAPNRDPYVPAPTGITDILNDDGVKIIRFTKPVSFWLKNPKADIKDSKGDTIPFQFNSGSKALQPWLTTGGNAQVIDQSATQHYGFRYWVDNSQSMNTPCLFQTFVKLYVSFKEQD